MLAGCAGVEQAAKNAGHEVTVPFTPGRMDASQEQTDVESFDVLEPIADGFRNYLKGKYTVPAEALLIDKAQLLTLTAPEMTVLVGGMRVLERQRRQVAARRLHQAAGGADQRLLREPARHGHGVEAGLERRRRVRRPRSQDGRTEVDRHARRSVFGSNSQLRALAEVYGSSDAQKKFVHDFVAAWNKVMNLDRFDLA